MPLTLAQRGLLIAASIIMAALVSLPTKACSDSDEVLVKEKPGNEPWEVIVPDERGEKTVWLDDNGLLTLMATVQGIKSNDTRIKNYERIFKKALSRYIADIETSLPKLVANKKLHTLMAGVLAKSKSLLKEIEKNGLTKKSVETFEKKIGLEVDRDYDRTTQVSHMPYKMKNGDSETKKLLPEFPLYDMFMMNAQGITARGGCSYTMKLESPGTTPAGTGTTTAAQPAAN